EAIANAIGDNRAGFGSGGCAKAVEYAVLHDITGGGNSGPASYSEDSKELTRSDHVYKTFDHACDYVSGDITGGEVIVAAHQVSASTEFSRTGGGGKSGNRQPGECAGAGDSQSRSGCGDTNVDNDIGAVALRLHVIADSVENPILGLAHFTGGRLALLDGGIAHHGGE